jgi:hypothetical protein
MSTAYLGVRHCLQVAHDNVLYHSVVELASPPQVLGQRSEISSRMLDGASCRHEASAIPSFVFQEALPICT